MKDLTLRLNTYIENHVLDLGDSNCETVLDQLYQAYAESHESDPAEIGNGFKELEEYLHTLPLEDNNAVFNLCCRLCSAYERKAFRDGLQYGAHLMKELSPKKQIRLCSRHKSFHRCLPQSSCRCWLQTRIAK